MRASSSLVYQSTESSELPAGQRYENWLMPMLSCCEALPPTERQRRDFRGRLSSLAAAGSELHDMRSDDFDGIHTPASIRRNDHDELALVYVIQGQVLSRHDDDADLATEAGQFLLIDSRRPKHTRFHQPHFMQINLPRARFQALLGNASLNQVSRAVSRSGQAGLLASQLGQFGALSPRLTPQEQWGFLEATESLAVGIVENACLHGGFPGDDGERLPGLYAAARLHISANLCAPGLSVDSIAGALGCSRSTLYRAFSEQGQSVAQYLRDARLNNVYGLLQEASAHYSIAEIAARCGFIDQSGFSRLFRQHFGVRPSDVRFNRRV